MRLTTLVRETIRRERFDARGARYHFIHIPKNAGESVRASLFLDREVSFSSPYHFRYVDIADCVGRDLRYFAVVRNPWSRTASRYQFGLQHIPRWSTDDPRRKYMETTTFSDFVRRREILPIPGRAHEPWMGPLSSWLNQLEWICDEDGAVVCDCIRMESLELDLSAFLGKKQRIRSTNVTERRYDYRSMYTDALAEELAEYFRDDIEYFGFTFDGPATRNVFAAD